MTKRVFARRGQTQHIPDQPSGLLQKRHTCMLHYEQACALKNMQVPLQPLRQALGRCTVLWGISRLCGLPQQVMWPGAPADQLGRHQTIVKRKAASTQTPLKTLPDATWDCPRPTQAGHPSYAQSDSGARVCSLGGRGVL